MINPSHSERFENVNWFCDNCGAFLNKQKGFSDWHCTWTCEECGYVNDISEDQIRWTEEDCKTRESGEVNDDSSEVIDDYGYGEEWMYEHPHRCKECDRLLNKQENYCDWLNYCIYEKCGFYNEWLEDLYSDLGVGEQEDGEESEEDLYSDLSGEDDDELYYRSQAEEIKRRVEEEWKKEKRKQHRKRIWRIIMRRRHEVGISSIQCRGMKCNDVIKMLRKPEFYNIKTTAIEDLPLKCISQEGTVESIFIEHKNTFDASTRFVVNAKIEIVYHMLQRVSTPLAARAVKNKNVEDVVGKFLDLGFRNYRESCNT